MSPNPPLDKSLPVNHKLHITLSIISFGSWLPIYVAYYLFCRLTGSSIEQRRNKRVIVREKRRSIRVRAKEGRRITQKIIKESSSQGYNSQKQSITGIKKKSFLVSQARTYTLSCNHQIRAKNINLIGKTVRCDVCNDYREVTGAIWAQH